MQVESRLLTRRQVMGGLVAASAMLAGCATQASRPKTYVLVHGAWHGAWAWEAVHSLLKWREFRVFAPTLKGLAERQPENGPGVTLMTHISEIMSLLDEEQLSDIVLVGHSYAGFVVTGVCDRRPERIAHVVCLDAFLPESGQKLYDSVNSPERLQQIRQTTKEKGQGYKAFPPSAANWGSQWRLDEIC